MEKQLRKDMRLVPILPEIHRSYIVNLKLVMAFTANDVNISKSELRIGDTYKALVQQIKIKAPPSIN